MVRLFSILLVFFPLWLSAAGPVVRDTDRGIELTNNHVSILLSHEAELLTCVEQNTGEDIAAHDHRKIASGVLKNGKSVYADRVALNGNQLSVFFGKDIVVLELNPLPDYFLLEVKEVPSSFESLSFIDLKMNYDYAQNNPFVAVGVALSLQTNSVYYPSGESKEVLGCCYFHTGFTGAKLALVACPKDELRGILKNIYITVPTGVLPVNLVSGGPYGLECKANYYDCVLIWDADPSMVPDWLRFYSSLGVRQYNFMHGSGNFVNGEFSFPKTGSATSFKEQITDPLYQAGVISILHTYSYYISYSAKELLSNPKWQQQLEFREEFKLANGLTSFAKEIEIVGGKLKLRNGEKFDASYTPYLLIDNEIIRYSVGDEGFVSCQRGQCGTRAETHKAGVTVRVIGGYFSHIVPKIGSDLFYEVARRTAKAYNEGGFRGFYFDAIDGLGVHLKNAEFSDFRWYYEAAFINEVLKYCEQPPLVVDGSDMCCSIWAARGKGEAWDTPSRGYKKFVDKHLSINKTLKDRMYVTTLGWYNFYPTNQNQPGDYATKYMFLDDVDFVGVKSIAYDQTMVYNNLREKDVLAIPGLKRNLDRYSQYNTLRMENYFSDEVKQALRTGNSEYMLVKRNGVWGFDEVVYQRVKLRDISQDAYIGSNPYKKQKPFIRLENLYSSDGSKTVRLMSSDELAGLTGKKCEKSFAGTQNLKELLGLKVTLQGNGVSSKDAVCIRLRSAETEGYADYVVRLNFEGIRDIIVTNTDNAEYKDLYFPDAEDNLYRMHRTDVDFSKVKFVQVFKSSNCKSADVMSIDAVPLVSNTLTNPVVTVNGTSVTFQGSLQSGEYLEYNAGERKAVVYDRIGNARTVKVKRKGHFRVPEGDFTATVTGESENENIPAEVSLTFGMFGKFIHN